MEICALHFSLFIFNLSSYLPNLHTRSAVARTRTETHNVGPKVAVASDHLNGIERVGHDALEMPETLKLIVLPTVVNDHLPWPHRRRYRHLNPEIPNVVVHLYKFPISNLATLRIPHADEGHRLTPL